MKEGVSSCEGLTSNRTDPNQQQAMGTCVQEKPNCSHRGYAEATIHGQHRNVNTEESFNCDQYPYETDTTDTNDEIYGCCLCNYRAEERQNLEKHMSTDTNQNVFACKQCSYRPALCYDLLIHMAKHARDNLFP